MNPILKNLAALLTSDKLSIIKGTNLILRNGDVHYPFRQDSDFLYLTGLNIPGLAVTLYNTGIILWREPIMEHDIIWGSDKITDEEMQKISGIEDIRDIADMEVYLSESTSFLSSGRRKDLPTVPGGGADSSLHSEGQEEKNAKWKTLIHEMRTIKSSDEIEKIKKCISITNDIYEEIGKKIKPGMYEYEIEAMIAHGFRRHHGVEAFPSIVASGINSCTLHYTANTRKIETGDIILIDFGIELAGYGADISRTFALGGFSSRQQKIYDAVENVKHFAEKTLKPKITRREWNIGVKNYMYDMCVGLGLKNIEKYTPLNNPYYPHSVGHFLGIDTHDVGDSDMPLSVGMILTIEPGIYIRDEAIGIRIEDDYLITVDGCVKL